MKRGSKITQFFKKTFGDFFKGKNTNIVIEYFLLFVFFSFWQNFAKTNVGFTCEINFIKFLLH
jgi:hypothetical protein